jgi:hypothetical protein
MTPEWILAVCAVLTIAGALVTVLWKFTAPIAGMYSDQDS